MKTTLQVDITFDKILSLVKQLPKQQKMALGKALEKDAVNSKLSALLNTFKTDELDEETVLQEVELVRQKIYEEQKH